MYKVAIACWLCLFVKGQANFANNSTVGYDPEELLSNIFSGNVTQRTRNFKFENEFDSNYNNIVFDDQNSNYQNPTQFKFEIDQETHTADIPNFGISNDDVIITNVKFEDSGQVLENGTNNLLNGGPQPGINGDIGKKKKRRKRKPRQQFPNQPGYWYPGYPLPTGLGPRPGVNVGPNHFPPEFNGQFYRPPRRPEPSLASGALTAVTGALTSIAHNDDYQCVARLLCEAAAGGALGSSSLLDSVSGLEPLLTLLSAYNGISSNPLFVFGRAAFLGISSKGSPGSCRYAYSLCPTDPEELVHYLNNHNGGFFRFFNAPQQGQQNLQQFYNQLSQNYGLYKPDPGNNQNFYGLANPGLYENPASPTNLYHNGNDYQQNYGFAYPYNQNYNNGYGLRFKSHNELNDDEGIENFIADGNKIEKRIQNKPASFLNDNFEESNSKWLFPGEDDNRDESKVGVQYVNADDFGFIFNTKAKKLRFPDTSAIYDIADVQKYNNKPITFDTVETQRKPKGIYSPDPQSSFKNTNDFYRPAYSNDNRFFFNNIKQRDDEDLKRLYNNYNNQNNNNDQQDNPGVTTVYVIRGNGDPNKPEIIKLRPGESL